MTRKTRGSGSGRPQATKNRDGEKPSGRTLVEAIRAGVALLTEKDLCALRKLRKKVIALNTQRDKFYRSRKSSGRIAIDSGATITLMKKQQWLKRLTARLTAIVRTASGEGIKTQARGPIQIMTKDGRGRHVKLDDIGDGHWLQGILFSLLSVSQLCDHGCTVVFKPKDAYMITKRGVTIPFEREGGL